MLDAYFDWGLKTTEVASNAITVAAVEAKGRKAFSGSEQGMMYHASLRSDFALICQHQFQQDHRL